LVLGTLHTAVIAGVVDNRVCDLAAGPNPG
jgi:hypothetical protein